MTIVQDKTSWDRTDWALKWCPAVLLTSTATLLLSAGALLYAEPLLLMALAASLLLAAWLCPLALHGALGFSWLTAVTVVFIGLCAALLYTLYTLFMSEPVFTSLAIVGGAIAALTLYPGLIGMLYKVDAWTKKRG